jgi:cell division protein FtsB
MAKKTLEELELESMELSTTINKLKKKKEYLVGEDIQKVDEDEVKKTEKQTEWLERELRKRKRLVKECLSAWS